MNNGAQEAGDGGGGRGQRRGHASVHRTRSETIHLEGADSAALSASILAVRRKSLGGEAEASPSALHHMAANAQTTHRSRYSRRARSGTLRGSDLAAIQQLRKEHGVATEDGGGHDNDDGDTTPKERLKLRQPRQRSVTRRKPSTSASSLARFRKAGKKAKVIARLKKNNQAEKPGKHHSHRHKHRHERHREKHHKHGGHEHSSHKHHRPHGSSGDSDDAHGAAIAEMRRELDDMKRSLRQARAETEEKQEKGENAEEEPQWVRDAKADYDRTGTVGATCVLTSVRTGYFWKLIALAIIASQMGMLAGLVARPYFCWHTVVGLRLALHCTRPRPHSCAVRSAILLMEL